AELESPPVQAQMVRAASAVRIVGKRGRKTVCLPLTRQSSTVDAARQRTVTGLPAGGQAERPHWDAPLVTAGQGADNVLWEGRRSQQGGPIWAAKKSLRPTCGRARFRFRPHTTPGPRRRVRDTLPRLRGRRNASLRKPVRPTRLRRQVPRQGRDDRVRGRYA